MGTKRREMYMLRMPFVTNMLTFQEIMHCKLGMGSSVKTRDGLHKAGEDMGVRRGRTVSLLMG